jgi:hypothetical protein
MQIRATLFLFFMAWTMTAAIASDDEVVERAVSGPSPQLQQMAPAPGRTIPAMTMEQQLAALQQQVQTLQAQVAALQSVLIVTPTGATLQAPSLSLLSIDGTSIRSSKGITVEAGTLIDVKSGSSTRIRAGSTSSVEAAGTLDLKGATTRLNGGGKPIATVGSAVGNGKVMTGSPTILGN